MSLVLASSCNRAPSEPASAVRPDPLPSATPAPMPSAAASSAPVATLTSATPPRCIVPLPASSGAVPAAAGPRCPPDPLQHPPALARRRISFPEAGASVDAELATTPEQSERGLMFRTKMGEGEGMFFALEDRKEQVFWMHNTCIPLDMLFIDEDGTIVGVVENAPVLDDDPRSVACPSRFVLEVNAGWVRHHGVKPGQKVALPSL